MEGDEEAKKRLKVILETLSGSKTIDEAAAELGIKAAMFHRLRYEWLEESMKLLLPKPLGRPRRRVAVESAELERARKEIESIRDELKKAHVREELSVALPPVMTRGRETEKKTKRFRKKQGN
jgi:hypothetical protein